MPRKKKEDETTTDFLGLGEGAEVEGTETNTETEGVNQESVETTETTETQTEGEGSQAAEGSEGAQGSEGGEFDGSAPGAGEAAGEAADDRVWKVGDTEVSKSEFIRHQFTNENLSRKQISEQFDINYRTVYGATMNMTNDAEPSTRGRSASSAKILVTADGRVVSVVKSEDGVDILHINNVAAADDALVITPAVLDEAGEVVTPAETVATTEVDRNTWIREQVTAGVSRADVATALGLSYGVVYGLTKESGGATQRHDVEIKDEEGNVLETISRSEHIRRLFAAGKTKAEIAKELSVDYPIVWAALKSLKPEAEKFADAIDKVAKFAEQVEDKEAFDALIVQLKAVTLKPETTEEAAAEEVAATDETNASAEDQEQVETGVQE